MNLHEEIIKLYGNPFSKYEVERMDYFKSFLLKLKEAYNDYQWQEIFYMIVEVHNSAILKAANKIKHDDTMRNSILDLMYEE